MINREWQTVSVITYTTGTDTYGQKRKQGTASRSTQMVIKIYSQTNTQDIRYNDVEYIGLTLDKAITDANTITAGGISYQILYVIPSNRYYQVLMKKA